MGETDFTGITITVLLSVLGLAGAFWAGRRNRQKPDMRSASDFSHLVSVQRSVGPEIKITFDDQPVPTVAKTYLALWNRRGDPVEGSKILKQNPLRIVVAEGDSVLQARVVSASRKEIELNVSESDGAFAVSFAFLAPGDGGVIEVIHRGFRPAKFGGVIVGAEVAGPQMAELSGRLESDRGSKAGPDRVKHFTDRFIGFLFVPSVIGITVAGLFLAVVSAVAGIFAESRLVDIDAFDLETREGQMDFAREVGNVIPLELIWTLGGMGVFLFLSGSVVLILLKRTNVSPPKSIFRLSVGKGPENTAGE